MKTLTDLIDGVSDEKLKSFYETCPTNDVGNVLAGNYRGARAIPFLISPASMNLVDEIRRKANVLRKMHFGKTVKLYAPLYISNYCVNNCKYCGFRAGNAQARRRLTPIEIEAEAKSLKNSKLDSVLVVCGEDPEYLTVDFIEETIKILKKFFSSISLEIFPLDTAAYERLVKAGASGLLIYQETYDRKLYDSLHSGPKKDFTFRLESASRAAEAGFHKIGLGVLLGLKNWIYDAAAMAVHAEWLGKKFWKTAIQFSFPRIRETGTDFKTPNPVGEDELERMMLAFRIAFPAAEISISTRENREFRDSVVSSCATMMSAASKVTPGAYSGLSDNELGQFEIRDTREVSDICSNLKNSGLDPVMKDWDIALNP
jgi:2-iminoacetate synthase